MSDHFGIIHIKSFTLKYRQNMSHIYFLLVNIIFFLLNDFPMKCLRQISSFLFITRDHSFSTFAKCLAHLRARIRGKEMLYLWKICERTKWMIPKLIFYMEINHYVDMLKMQTRFLLDKILMSELHVMPFH